MNCRIVSAISQHNFVHAQTVLVSFQGKKAHYFEKSKKIVTLTNYFIHETRFGRLTAVEVRAKVGGSKNRGTNGPESVWEV